MKTKAEIVQRLLEAKQIDAEEAVILLMSENKATYLPYPYNPFPYQPWQQWPYGTPVYVNSFPNYSGYTAACANQDINVNSWLN